MNQKKNRRSSVLWNYFTILKDRVAICNICHAKISFKSTISNMKKHLDNRHPKITVPGLVSYKESRKAKLRALQEKKSQEVSEVEENNAQIEIITSDLNQDGDVDVIVENENIIETSEVENDNFEDLSDDQSSNVNIQSPRITKVFSQNRKNSFEEHKINDLYFQKNINSTAQKILQKRGDSYDCFGKYIASLLRDIGQPASLSLQEEITSMVLRKLCFLNA